MRNSIFLCTVFLVVSGVASVLAGGSTAHAQQVEAQRLDLDGYFVDRRIGAGWHTSRRLNALPEQRRDGNRQYVSTRIGVQGQSLSGFALRISTPVDGVQLQYMCHIGHAGGDTPWLSVPVGTETVNQAPFCGNAMHDYATLQGVAVRLVGGNAGTFSVRYRCVVQDVGAGRWYANGEFCGVRDGRALRMDSFEIEIVRNN